MTFPDIYTARLRLCAMTDEPRKADESEDHAALAHALHCSIAPQWPPEHWEPHVFTFLNEQFTARPEQVAWNRYIVLRGERDMLVGNCNAFAIGPTEAEIGYSVVPAFHGQGIATEAVKALLAYLRTHTPITSARARTFPHLTRSVRVLQKCGFAYAGPGEEQGTVRYVLSLM